MKKVLLVDTNISSLPIYEYLINNKYNVHVAGSNPNDFLAKYTENYINIDYKDIELLKKIIQEYNFDFLIPGCNDVSYSSCCSVNSYFNFNGLESINNNEIINNKSKFREFSESNNLSVPKRIFDFNNLVNYPIIIKPVDSYSGKGITLISSDDKDKIKTAIKYAQSNSKNNDYIIEEFISGQLYSHSAFIKNQSVYKDFIVKEDCTANPFAVDTSRVVYDFPKKILNNIRNEISKLSNILKLNDGLIHSQFILMNDKFWIIEPTRRCPGDLYSLLINYSTNFNYVEHYVSPFLNLNITKATKSLKRNILRHTITNESSGRFKSLKMNFNFNIIEYFQFKNSGDLLEPAPSGRIGIIFSEYKNKSLFNENYNNLLNKNMYNLF